MKLPTLYKKTSTGAMQFWSISLKEVDEGCLIKTIYGHHGTENQQSTEDLISKGKNLGKVNETTPFEQARLEAQAKHTKQKKKGYVDNIEDAQESKVDAVITGGINPMLAHAFEKHGHKLPDTVLVQAKLDGIRCIATVHDGRWRLWTRTRKPINSCTHIEEELERFFPAEAMTGDFFLDGELYNHEYKDNFEAIVSAVRKDNPTEEAKKVQYHIYDGARGGLALGDFILSLLKNCEEANYLKVLPTLESLKTDVNNWCASYQHSGYEGAMVRDPGAPYEFKRSYSLQKVKTFSEEEFPVVGIKEGRGKLRGHVGAFVCKLPNGETFDAKLEGSLDRLKDLFEQPSKWQNKNLTVKFQGLTVVGKPRFPVGKALRDYE